MSDDPIMREIMFSISEINKGNILPIPQQTIAVEEEQQIQLQEFQEEDNSIVQVITQRVPERVFIVPYRNRPQQKFFFSKQMSFLLEDEDDYEIYFVHQNDARYFNRGGMKNIGFLAMKEKYPNDYQDINFIFNDVDTLPFNKLFDYRTEPGFVKHYYGFDSALGGIVVIKGGDFEIINGYPNYWGWGMEDACLQKRCLIAGIQIDRSQFYTIGSPEILQLFDGVSRLVSKKDPLRMKTDNGMDGIRTIRDLRYNTENSSSNPADNEFVLEDERIQIVNVNHFMTGVSFQKDTFHEYDLREPVSKVAFPDKPPTQKTMISQEEWKNIPYNSQFQEINSQIMQQQQKEEQKNLMLQQVRKQIMMKRQQNLMKQQQMQQQMQKNSATYIFSQENARKIEADVTAQTEITAAIRENIMKQRELAKASITASQVAQSKNNNQRKAFNISLGGLR